MATQGFVQVPPDSTGKKVDTVVTATAAQHRHVMSIGDPSTDAALAAVTAANGLAVDVTRLPALVAGSAVIGHVIVDTAPTTAVTGPLTDTQLRASAVPVSGTFFQATQPVSAASLPLPTGAATAALQTQPGVDIGDVTINNAAGASAVNVQDGGNSLTVDGTLTAVTSITNVVHVDDNAGSLTVDGTVTANAGTGTFTTAEVAPTTVLHGVTNVTTAGTRVVLASSTTCKSVTIKAKTANTGVIYVGSSTVAAANGYPLAPGDSVSLDIANLNTVNIDSSVNGEGVSYLGVN